MLLSPNPHESNLILANTILDRVIVESRRRIEEPHAPRPFRL